MQKKLTNFIYIILGVLLISFILWNRTSGNNPLTPIDTFNFLFEIVDRMEPFSGDELD